MNDELILYRPFLEEILSKIQTARFNMLKAVSKETINLYWSIGKSVCEKVRQEKWGMSVVEKLSKDLQNEFPGIRGFSARNIWRMKTLYDYYEDKSILTPLVAEIGWVHNCIILEKCKDDFEKEFYLKLTKERGWSKNDLIEQIDKNYYHNVMLAQNNFDYTVAEDIKAKVAWEFIDDYNIELINPDLPIVEKELENSIVSNIVKFLQDMNGNYAFGMLLPEVYNPTTNYRFGFNGMLRDDDIKEQYSTYPPKEGTGNSYSTEFRMYDPRIGRWWSLDPKPTASESWYVGLGNNPISFTDFRGDTVLSTQEGFDIANEGITATLGNSHPFSYDSKSGQWQVDNDFNISKYSPDQMKVYDNIKGNIDNPAKVQIDIVNIDEKYYSNLNNGDFRSLKERGGIGQTLNNFYMNPEINDKLIKVARNPYNFFLFERIDYHKILTLLHELKHSLNSLKSIVGEEDLHSTEEYENTIRDIYMVPLVFPLNILSPNSKVPIGGKATPHRNSEK